MTIQQTLETRCIFSKVLTDLGAVGGDLPRSKSMTVILFYKIITLILFNTLK
jgi:hypothetical protein